MADGGDYVLGHDDREMQRLAAQERLIGDLTDHVFRLAGLATGMRVLDVGSGGGDVAIRAVRHVAPDGTVVGIDRSAEGLETATRRAAEAGLADRVSFVVADAADPPSGPFDAVVGRLVLMYQPDPLAVLRTLVSRLRPGGLVAFQEIVISRRMAFGDAPLFERCTRAIVRGFALSGADPDFGVRLPRLLEAAGLDAVESVIGQRLSHGAPADVTTPSVEVLHRLVPIVRASEPDLVVGLDDPEIGVRLREDAARVPVTGPAYVGAWGRRPG